MIIEDKRIEITLFAITFWMCIISILFPIGLLFIFEASFAIIIWLTSIFIIGGLFLLASIFFKNRWVRVVYLWIPLTLFPVAIMFIISLILNLIKKSATYDTTDFSGFVKPYYINWEIFNIFYFLSKKELYKFRTDDIKRFTHHKLIYHKPSRNSDNDPNTIIELVDREDYALLLLEIGDQS